MRLSKKFLLRVVDDGNFVRLGIEGQGGPKKDLDEAVAIAARVPSARYGSIEVRPIIPHEMPS